MPNGSRSSTSSIETSFALLPPCADPGFDHRSCDYWEDADRGSKAIRLDWLEPPAASDAKPPTAGAATASATRSSPMRGSGRPTRSRRAVGGGSNPFLADDDEAGGNPFAPRRAPKPTVGDGAPPKLRLLGRGLAVVGSYAKVLLLDDVPAAYCQFGPLSAYPRAHADARAVPGPPGCAAARRHHLHRVDRRGAWRRPRPDPGRCRLRRPRAARVRGRRDLPGNRAPDPMRPVLRRRASGRPSGSLSRRPTTASRSCAASSGESSSAATLVAPRRPRGDGHGRDRVHPAPAIPDPGAGAPEPRPRRPSRRPRASAGVSGVVVDPSLLDLLPPDVNGVSRRARTPRRPPRSPPTASIGLFVSAIALAAAFGPIATDTAADYVVVTVARLKPGTFDELFFRGWRDTFDAAVCEQAGGVSGHAESRHRRPPHVHRDVRRRRPHLPRPPAGQRRHRLDAGRRRGSLRRARRGRADGVA